MRNSALPDAIVEFRARRGVSQAAVAGELKVSVRHLYRLEHGCQAITPALRRRLTEVARKYGDTELLMLVEMATSPRVTGHLDARFAAIETRVRALEQAALFTMESPRSGRGVA